MDLLAVDRARPVSPISKNLPGAILNNHFLSDFMQKIIAPGKKLYSMITCIKN